MLIVTLMATYIRNIKPIGLDRLCGFTGTVFGPGFLAVRVGLHFVFGAIDISVLYPTVRDTRPGSVVWHSFCNALAIK